MASQLNTKLRFVRCPKCRGILPELAPVYQCAGCGTVLQAKKRKNDTTDTGSHVHDTPQQNELEHVSDDKQGQSFSQKETCPSTCELPRDKTFASDQNEIQDSNGEQSGDTRFSGKLSTELIHHPNEESPPEVRAETEVDQDECSLEQNNGGDQNEYEYGNGKRAGGVSFCDEVASSTELNHHESEESSPLAGAHSDEKQLGGANFSDGVASSYELNHHESVESSPLAGANSEEDFKQNSERNQGEYGYCNGKQLVGENFSDGVASSSELIYHESEESSPLVGAHSEEVSEQNTQWNQNGYGYCNGKQLGGSHFSDGVHSEVDENRNCLDQKNGRNQGEYGDYIREWSGNIKISCEISSSTELTCQEIEESSPVVGTNTELDENFKSRFIFGSLIGVENLLAASPWDSAISAQRPLGESNIPDNQMSPHSEQLEQSQKRTFKGFDRVSSEDTLEDFALANPSSEFGVTLKDMPKSLTTRYYADDYSVSSYDGNDDQVPDQYQLLSRRKFQDAESASIKAMPRRDEVELQYQAWNCSSISSEQNHNAMKGSKWCQDELVRSRTNCETEERKVPFYSRGDKIGCDNGNPLSYGWNDFQCSSSFDSLNKPRDLEGEKMELLEMVYELQDQLNRTHISQGKKQIPSYYDRVASEVEKCHDLNNSRCDQRRNWPHRSRISRIPFSSDPTINRHQVDHSCFHGCPQDWHCSAPLPPHIFPNKIQYNAPPSQKYYNFHSSIPPSPQHYTSSEFSLRSCDAKSDDHWHPNHHEAKKFSRERHHLMKRHVLPVAGGAPFLVCYGCLKLLQLPADFLLFGRKCLRLRCSACSVILKFSLQNGTHILPYTEFTPETIAPPPSNVDDYSDSNNGRRLASVSYGNYSPQVDPVSYSDDCGPSSLRQSCSTEGEPFSAVLPLHALDRESNDRKMSSGSSFEPMEGREKQPIFEESQKKYKNPVKTFALFRSLSKKSKADELSSEIEGLPPKSGSTLHRLMGYSSPSQVLDS